MKTVYSSLDNGSPGEIRTLVNGSKADCIQEMNSTVLQISDCRKTVHGFWEHLMVVERLSKKVCRDYRGVARRFLKHSGGEVSRKSILEYLKTYLNMKQKTYNNIIDALKAFIARALVKCVEQENEEILYSESC